MKQQLAGGARSRGLIATLMVVLMAGLGMVSTQSAHGAYYSGTVKGKYRAGIQVKGKFVKRYSIGLPLRCETGWNWLLMQKGYDGMSPASFRITRTGSFRDREKTERWGDLTIFRGHVSERAIVLKLYVNLAATDWTEECWSGNGAKDPWVTLRLNRV